MDQMLDIRSFSGGLNEYVAEGLVELNESMNCKNCDINSGSLKSIISPSIVHTVQDEIQRILPFHGGTFNNYLYTMGNKVYNVEGDNLYTLNSGNVDSINFEHKSNK